MLQNAFAHDKILVHSLVHNGLMNGRCQLTIFFNFFLGNYNHSLSRVFLIKDVAVENDLLRMMNIVIK